MVVFLFGYMAVKNGTFNLLDSEAQSNNYDKTYQAGNLVNYGLTKIRKDSGIAGDFPFVSMKSIGKTIEMPARPGGPIINGWRSPLINASTYDKNFKRLKPNKRAVNPKETVYVPAWSYLSKEITIPKNKSKKPMALYVCWRALSGKETSLKIQFAGPTLNSKNSRERWQDKHGVPHMNYVHRYEQGDNEWQKIKCWGFYDIAYQQIIPRSHPQSEPIHAGQYMKIINKSIKARVNIKVFGQIEIASIKVFNPTQPPARVTKSADYYNRQFESDITE